HTTVTPSSSNFLSCLPSSESNSSEYDNPEQPPPFTPMRRKTFSSFCSSRSFFTCVFALSVSASAISPSSSSFLGCAVLGRRLLPLLLVVLEGRLDGILGQDGAMDLHGRQLELVHDVRVLDLGRFLHRAPLEPLRGQAGGGDGATAAEGLELGVLDDARIEADRDLEHNDVAGIRSDVQRRP